MAKQAESAEILPTTIRLADAQLSAITSFEEALLLVHDATGGDVESTADYGSGFTLLASSDKKRLVGVDFIIVEWDFHASPDYTGQATDNLRSSRARAAALKAGLGNVFVSARIVTVNGDKLVLNDGGAGIFRDLDNISAMRENAGRRDAYVGLTVLGGLTASEYTYTDDKGNSSKACTYYLSGR